LDKAAAEHRFRRLVEPRCSQLVHFGIGRHLGVAPPVARSVGKPGVEQAGKIDRLVAILLGDHLAADRPHDRERLRLEKARSGGGAPSRFRRAARVGEVTRSDSIRARTVPGG
jgi:hypothetical protein